ncbi:Arylesterase [Candidatus Rhodobacter oscarellae]|uniref:Arylesterase n=1 Tax=Candidatus Rhodobacter oscarellae TaxID=1675527 RepID=A0A0J9E8W6_9RHOB|nr:SGNH/GDSL hydrolase family protein [Candidatus Rhodobacter lobularis]KMW59227.1 Arylesterase [Candidatus Rhodobacter lobularis]
MSDKTILCFGDSNTHGTIAMVDWNDRRRFPKAQRWPSVMAGILGDGYDVIPEGQSGRNAAYDDPIEGKHRNGERTLLALLESHRPIDLLVIMLGTNDLKARFGAPPIDIALAIERLAKLAIGSDTGPNDRAPKVLLVAPVPIEEVGYLGELFAGGAEKSRALPGYLEKIAERQGAGFLDLAPVAQVDPVDGVHLTAEAQAAIGRAIAAKALSMLGGG